MTVTTTSLYTGDSKQSLWKLLKDEFAALTVAYPDKVNVKVTKIYPKLAEELDKYLAIITIARVTAPQEMLFVGDNLTASLNTDSQWASTLGVLNTDYYEVCVWSFDPDYRDQIYYVVRQIMLEKRKYLLQQGFVKVVRTGGGDQEVDLVGLPRIIYRGIHMYMIQASLQVDSVQEVVSSINITQTNRVELNSSTNEIEINTVVP